MNLKNHQILERLKATSPDPKHPRGVTYLRRVHKRSRQRIYQALNGEANELLQKIIHHIEFLESRGAK